MDVCRLAIDIITLFSCIKQNVTTFLCTVLKATLSTTSTSTLSGLIARECGPGFTVHCRNFSDFRIVLRIINLAIQLRK